MEHATFELGAITVGAPRSYSSLVVFPLFHQAVSTLGYLLGEQALESGKISVHEANQSGVVAEILMKSKADKYILFLEGQQLLGAKQNRVLNTSVLVPPKEEIRVPVSCVEQRRWSYKSQGFSSSETSATSSLRYALRSSVSRSVSTGMGYRSDQSEVWSRIERQQTALATSSPTSALSDTYEAYSDQLAPYEAEVPYVAESHGLAIAVGPRIVSIDLYDKASTCEKQWRRLVKGTALDAIQNTRERSRLLSRQASSKKGDGMATQEIVQSLLGDFGSAKWVESSPPGAGVEYRATLDGFEASVLYFDKEPLWFGAVAMA